MPKPTGRYLYSNVTLQKAEEYLNALKEGSQQPGGELKKILGSENLNQI